MTAIFCCKSGAAARRELRLSCARGSNRSPRAGDEQAFAQMSESGMSYAALSEEVRLVSIKNATRAASSGARGRASCQTSCVKMTAEPLCGFIHLPFSPAQVARLMGGGASDSASGAAPGQDAIASMHITDMCEGVRLAAEIAAAAVCSTSEQMTHA